MKKILHLFAKYEIWLLAFLKPFGFWGAGALAFIDAGAFPVPMDLILATYVWADKKHFYLYVIASAAGSALGGLVFFLLGRAGGELFLMKRIDRARYEQLRDRFEKQEFLAMMIPSILPPPTPWKLFVIAAGVFEMKLSTFLMAVFARPGDPQPDHGDPDHRVRAGDRAHRRTIGDPAPVAPGSGPGRAPCRAGLLGLADGVETAGQEGLAWG